METPRILVVDDEPQIQKMLQVSLSAHHYQVSTAETGQEGITLAALLPLLWVFRKKRPEKSGVKGAATPSPGEAVSGKTDKTTIYRTKPE